MDSIKLSLLTQIISLLLHECYSWPEGTYGIPMPTVGCPQTEDFEWQEGSRTQHTQPGSHAIDGVHLAGMTATVANPSDQITSTFCMKTSYAQDGDSEWEKGSYCIYKKDRCPRGFHDGWIYWDDNVPLTSLDNQEMTGTLPDGEYGRNTRINFCCRKDGYQHHVISLPSRSPFYLLRYGGSCQQVEDTELSEEWVYWSGEDSLNWDGQDGVYPFRERSIHPTAYSRLFYCYYTPKPASSRLAILLAIAYVAAAVAGFVFIAFVIVCVCQRLSCCPCSKRRKERPHNAEAHEAMLALAPPETYTTTGVIYRPSDKDNRTRAPGDDSHDVIVPIPAARNPRLPEQQQQQTTQEQQHPPVTGVEMRPPPQPAPRPEVYRREADCGLAQVQQPGILPQTVANPGVPSVNMPGNEQGGVMSPPLSPDPRPMSLPPSYDEVISRLNGANQQR